MTNRIRVQVTLLDPEGKTLDYGKFTYSVPQDDPEWDDLEGYIMDDILGVATTA